MPHAAPLLTGVSGYYGLSTMSEDRKPIPVGPAGKYHRGAAALVFFGRWLAKKVRALMRLELSSRQEMFA
jgi:hypothetical protein